jgi:hypothetical protein
LSNAPQATGARAARSMKKHERGREREREREYSLRIPPLGHPGVRLVTVLKHIPGNSFKHTHTCTYLAVAHWCCLRAGPRACAVLPTSDEVGGSRPNDLREWVTFGYFRLLSVSGF